MISWCFIALQCYYMWNGSQSACHCSAGNDCIIPFLPGPGGAHHQECLGLLLVTPLFHQPDNCCSCRAEWLLRLRNTVSESYRRQWGWHIDGSTHRSVSAAKLTLWPVQIRTNAGKRHVEDEWVTVTYILMLYHKFKVVFYKCTKTFTKWFVAVRYCWPCETTE